MFLFVYRKLVWQSWEFVSKIGQDQEVNMTLCLSATLWLEVGIYRRSRNSELSAACKRLQICLSELVVQCFFQISIRALTYIVPHLEFVKRSVPMKLDVCVTKTALPTKIQCVVVTEQLYELHYCRGLDNNTVYHPGSCEVKWKTTFENHYSVNEVKKLWCYRRLIKRTLLQVLGLRVFLNLR